MELLKRVQAHVRAQTVTEHHKHVPLPSFAVYLHAADTGFDANVAFPTTPLPTVSPAELDELCGVFAARGCAPHVAFLDAFAPHLQKALLAGGLSQVSCAQVMACTPDTLIMPSLSPNVEIITLAADAVLDDVREGLDVNELGFDPNAACATDQAAAQFRETLGNCRAFTLRYHGQGVSAGMFVPVHNGVTEVVGIATLEAFRRRGFATAITAYITQAAFDYGADLVYLSTASEQAGHVYARVGFQICGTLRTYGAQQPA